MYQTLKDFINQYIKTNGVRAITGNLLNGVLIGMVDTLGKVSGYGGIITPSSAAPQNEGNVFFVSNTAGTYTNFSNIVVNDNELAFIYRSGNGWAKDGIMLSAGGTYVEANPEGEATEPMTKIRIGDTIYTAPAGVGIASIAKTGTSGLVDTYTITLTNGNKETFTVTNGAPGSPGVPGQSSYVHIKYADDASGTNMSDNPNGKDYIGFLTDHISSASSTPSDYTWAKFVGPEGSGGGGTLDDTYVQAETFGGGITPPVTPGAYVSTDTFNQLASDVANILDDNVFIPLLMGVNTPTIENNAYWQQSNGELVRLTESVVIKSTSPILCKKGTVIVTTSPVTFPVGVSFITKVTESNTGIECLVSGSTSAKQYWYVVDEECYIVISINPSSIGSVRVIPSQGLEVLLDYVRDKHDNLIMIDENPLKHIIRDCGYGSVIHHWGIIGDSLSSGELHTHPTPSSSAYTDYYEYSWGQRLAKIIGALSCYNFSNGGQTAKGWIEGTVDGSSDIVHGSDFVGGVGGGGWPLAKTSEYKKQAYIIALGVNDHNSSVSGYGTGTISDIGSYNPSQDTDTNGDSFVGYYAGIIQRIKSIQPDAKIFCVTIPNSSFSNENTAIRDIVDYFHTEYSGDVYLIDLANYLPIKWAGDYMYNSHGSAQGYQYIAYAMNTYIDWLIRKNADDFKTMPLITI